MLTSAIRKLAGRWRAHRDMPWRPLPLRTKLIGWGVLIVLLVGAWVLYATHHHGWPIYALLFAAGLVFVNLLNVPGGGPGGAG